MTVNHPDGGMCWKTASLALKNNNLLQFSRVSVCCAAAIKGENTMPMCVHRIRPGDSLSAIAGQYGFGTDWKPIWNYNTQVKKVLHSGNKNDIPAGTTIVIPRTAREYAAAINGLQDLLGEIDKDTAKSLKELDGYKAEADRTAAAVDITADVLFAAKGAAKASIKYGPRYAQYIIRKEALTAVMSAADKLSGLGESNEGLVVKNAGKATIEQSVMLQAKRAFDAQKGQRSFATGMAQSMGKKAAVTSAKAIAPVEMANGVGEAVDILCDVALAVGKGAIAAVEAVAPSKVAKAFIWATAGEHPDDTNARMKKHVADTGRKSAERLRTTIAKLQSEQKVVHSAA